MRLVQGGTFAAAGPQALGQGPREGLPTRHPGVQSGRQASKRAFLAGKLPNVLKKEYKDIKEKMAQGDLQTSAEGWALCRHQCALNTRLKKDADRDLYIVKLQCAHGHEFRALVNFPNSQGRRDSPPFKAARVSISMRGVGGWLYATRPRGTASTARWC